MTLRIAGRSALDSQDRRKVEVNMRLEELGPSPKQVMTPAKPSTDVFPRFRMQGSTLANPVTDEVC